jgi:pimeloyl-ACP methyl ester carboxylesterase
MNGFQSHQIETRDGLLFSCAEQGDPDGLPVVLLHGYTDSWRSFAPLMARLPRRFRTVALTQRGHGDSVKPAKGYAIADFAADLDLALDALGIARPVLVGHSMGSLVATRFAIDHPGRVAGLVLMGAFTTLKGNQGGEALWQEAVASLDDPIAPALARSFQESTLARPVPPAFLEGVIAESLKVPARVWRAALRGMLDDDFSAALPLITAPALVVWGERDEFTGRIEQDALISAIPGAMLKIHSNCGHAPHWEDPETVARQIVSFIDTRIAMTAPANQFGARAAAGW